jgi:hypothetical protein
MSHIFLEPGRRNPNAEEEGHWKIMIKENGKNRHLNDATSKADAFEKGKRAAAKRNIAFSTLKTNPADEVKELPPEVQEVIPEADPDEPSYMSVPRPRGAPALGDTVKFHGPDGDEELLVVDYLAEQFIGLADGNRQRIVHVSENWNPL